MITGFIRLIAPLLFNPVFIGFIVIFFLICCVLLIGKKETSFFPIPNICVCYHLFIVFYFFTMVCNWFW